MEITAVSDRISDLYKFRGEELIGGIEELLQIVGKYLEESGFIGMLAGDVGKNSEYIPPDLKIELLRASTIFAQSPFFVKANKEPGSHRVIETILDYSPSGKFSQDSGTVLDRFLLETALANQHREKIRIQTQVIMDAIFKSHAQEVRIISLGCGQSPEVQGVFTSESLERMHELSKKVHFIFLDRDKDALRISEKRIIDVGNMDIISYECVHGNVLRYAKRVQEKFNLVIAGGLFDYFEDRTIEEIVKLFYEQLYIGGNIFFTNISDGIRDTSIDRTLYSYNQAIYDFILLRAMIGWIMHHRTKDRLVEIVESGIGKNTKYSISKISQERTYGVLIGK